MVALCHHVWVSWLCVAGNVKQSPLKLNGFEASYVLSTWSDLSRRIFSHYKSQVLREMYKVGESVSLL
jgi:hypothetical protein